MDNLSQGEKETGKACPSLKKLGYSDKIKMYMLFESPYKIKYTTFLKILPVLLILIASTVGFATTLKAQSLSGAVSVAITPNIPEAYEEVVVRLSSSGVDLERSVISWSLDGEVKLSGVGEVQARFTTGAIGEVSRLTIVIETTQNRHITKNISIRPVGVDVLWSAFSYTPPFYKGKAQSPSGGLVVLTAMPELVNSKGEKLDPSELIYTWEERGVILGNASGYGKQRIVLQGGLNKLYPLVIAVTVSSFDGTLKARKSATISTRDPQIIFYEKHPLEGIKYSQALTGTLSIVQAELTLRGEPYFFSLDDIARNLIRFRWKINNKDINIPLNEQKNEMTFRRESGGSGKAQISLSIENDNLPFRVLQSARRTLDLNFGL